MKPILNFYKNQDKIIFWANLLSLIFALIILIILGINFKSLPHKLPLFYSLPWGENRLINSTQFILLPVLIVLVLLINLVTSWHLHSSQLLIKRILAVSSMVISLLILTTALKIISIFI